MRGYATQAFFLLLVAWLIPDAATAQVNCTTLTATNNGTSTASVVYDAAIDIGGVTYDLRGTTTATTGSKFVTFSCVGGMLRVQVQSALGGAGTATVKWEALDASSNVIVIQNFFFELIDLDGPNIEYVEFDTETTYCSDSTGTMSISTMGMVVTVAGTVNNPADNAQVNGSGGFEFEITYGVALTMSTNRWFEHGLMTGDATDLLDECTGCGNGTIATDEGCDDSNWQYGDGCNSGCLVEEGSVCGTIGLTGSASCEIDLGCNTTGGPPGICQTTCLDGNLDAGEACDDGNMVDTDSCSNSCLVNLGFSVCSINIDCTDAAMGVECNSGVCEYGLQEGPCTTVNQCETGLICDSTTSTCLIDEGNGTCTVDADCATASCNTMTGICAASVCGNDVIEGSEECDDGGIANGDGCDSSCQLESGCFSQPPSYAVSQTNMGVDDPDNALGAPQNMVTGSAQLRRNDILNLTFDVPLAAGTTVTIFAATNNNTNGRMTITESTDGMSYGAASVFNTFVANDTIEEVTYVTTSADVTHIRIVRNNRRIYIDALTFEEFFNCSTCGDGSVDLGEECDDNNTTNDDGCSDNCVIDPTATCSGEPSVCEFPSGHTSIGSIGWQTDEGGAPLLTFNTVSQAGAVAYQVEWSDGNKRKWERGEVPAKPFATGASYALHAPAANDRFSRSLKIVETNASGVTQLAFEGIVPAVGVSVASSTPSFAMSLSSVRSKTIDAISSFSGRNADAVAIHLASEGVFSVNIDELAPILNMDEATLQYEVESGAWGLTAEGQAVPSAFDATSGSIYLASRWYERIDSATVAHIFAPIDESWASLAEEPPPAVLLEDGAHSQPLPYASDPMITMVEPSVDDTEVVAASGMSRFFGHVRMDVEVNSFAGLAAAPPLEREFWFWQYLDSGSPTAFSYTFATQSDGWRTDSDLRLRVFSAPSADGSVTQTIRATLNGQIQRDINVSASGYQTVIFNSIGALRSGENTLTIQVLGGNSNGVATSGYVFVDGLSLEASADWSSMEGAPPNSVYYSSQGTDAVLNDAAVVPARVVFDLTANRFIVAADGYFPRSRAATSYLVHSEQNESSLFGHVLVDRDVLLDERVDYLVFAAHGLEDAATKLISWRRSRGLTSTTVSLPDVFDSFGFGVPSQSAIHEYLRAYQARWQELPKYIVLMGAGSLNRSSDPAIGYSGVPPKMHRASDGLYATHAYLSDVDRDGVEDTMVGQIPVRSLAEALVVVNKIQHFESLGDQAWANAETIIAAGENRGLSYSKISQLVDASLDPRLRRELFDANALEAEEAAGVFLKHLQQGAAWFNYMGHGSFDQIGDGAIVKRDDLRSLELTLQDSGAYSFFTSMSCTTSRSELAGFDSIGERLLKVDRGGAIAVWGPSGTSRAKETLPLSILLGRALVEEVDDRSVGNLIAIAKAEAIKEGVPADAFDLFLLFGDPATQIPVLVEAVETPSPRGGGGRCSVSVGLGNAGDRNALLIPVWVLGLLALFGWRRSRGQSL